MNHYFDGFPEPSDDQLQSIQDEELAARGKAFYDALMADGEDIEERHEAVRELDQDNELAGIVGELQGLWEEYDITGDDTIVNGAIRESEIALGELLDERNKPRYD